jgi:3'-phosphoadenosine 5'-phosphosulfate sulfotransferase (PAPS reductase)/FAD synthetase
MRRQVVSLSGGKDSTAMLLMMLERGERVDEAVMFDGGWEFPEMYEHIDKLRREVDVPITVVKPPHPLEWYMTNYRVTSGKRKGMYGLGFPRPFARWCTRIKRDVMRHYLCGGELVCIGIAADEDRPLEEDKRYPLIEWGVTERQALEYCLARGFTWGGLYDHMSRVSCWCCPLQSLDSSRALRRTHPELWQRLLEMERDCDVLPNNTFRANYSAQGLEERFAMEDRAAMCEEDE